MNTYLIKSKIATVAELREPFVLEGYELSSYNPEWWRSDGWVASKEIEADNAGKAKGEFMRGLLPLVPELSVVSQCAFRLVLNTYFIYRLADNPKKIIYVYYIREAEPVGLHFDEPEKANLTKIHNIENKHGLFFIADAANAGSLYTNLSMLLIGIEGLAGEIESRGIKRTNKAALKEILGDELYLKLYPYGEGLRHQLFHGNVRDHGQFDGLVEKVYTRICLYLKTRYSIFLEENVVHPQRNFHGNFEQAASYGAFRGEPVLDLKAIHESFDDNRQQIFTFVSTPEQY